MLPMNSPAVAQFLIPTEYYTVVSYQTGNVQAVYIKNGARVLGPIEVDGHVADILLVDNRPRSGAFLRAVFGPSVNCECGAESIGDSIGHGQWCPAWAEQPYPTPSIKV